VSVERQQLIEQPAACRIGVQQVAPVQYMPHSLLRRDVDNPHQGLQKLQPALGGPVLRYHQLAVGCVYELHGQSFIFSIRSFK
jgi:hypothetical protein